VRFEVLVALTVKITVVCDVTRYSLAYSEDEAGGSSQSMNIDQSTRPQILEDCNLHHISYSSIFI
jgi:hypothetical protein